MPGKSANWKHWTIQIHSVAQLKSFFLTLRRKAGRQGYLPPAPPQACHSSHRPSSARPVLKTTGLFRPSHLDMAINQCDRHLSCPIWICSWKPRASTHISQSPRQSLQTKNRSIRRLQTYRISSLTIFSQTCSQRIL